MGTSRGSYPQVICFHLSPRNPGLSINISEKIVSQVGYPNTKLDITVSQIFTTNNECPAVFLSSLSPKVLNPT